MDRDRSVRKRVSEVTRNKVRNMLLVSCFIGRTCNIPIPNSFLRNLSRHSEPIYYCVRRDLEGEGLIVIRGQFHNEYVEITEGGVRRLSQLLVGVEKENLEWRDVVNVVKKEMPIFWPPATFIEDSIRSDLLMAVLLLYSESYGTNPREYYENLINMLLNDYRKQGAQRLIITLFERLVELYSRALAISSVENRDEQGGIILSVFRRFSSALLTGIENVCQSGVALSRFRFNKKVAYLVGPLISYNHIVRAKLFPAFFYLSIPIVLLLMISNFPITKLFILLLALPLAVLGLMMPIIVISGIAITIIIKRNMLYSK